MVQDLRTYIPPEKKRHAKRYVVNVPVAPLLRIGSTKSAVDTQLLYGTQFLVCQVSRGWAWGQEVSPIKGSNVKGYVGFVKAKQLSENTFKPSHVVSSLKAPVFKGRDIKSPILTYLHLGAGLKGKYKAEFLETELGFVHKLHIGNISVESGDYVMVAESHAGLPYVWGGISSDGLDCSGLVQASLRSIGQDAPRDSDMQAKMGKEVTRKQGLKRGDLVFWKGHVGIMQSASKIIHANAYHMKVESELLSTAIKRIKEKSGPITAIRRLEF